MSLYATMLQNAAMNLLQAGFGSRFKTYRNTPMLQIAPSDLPVLGVYILRERFVPLGSYNHAEPKFQTELTMGFSGAVHGETDEQNQMHQIEDWISEELMQILFTNPKFVNLTEGMTSIERTAQYAKVGETTLWEIRLEMAMTYASRYPPKVEDDFNLLHITLKYPPNVDQASVLEIIRIYEIEQNLIKQSKAGMNGGQSPHQP